MNKSYIEGIKARFLQQELTQEDVNALISYVAIEPCNSEAYVLLLEIAWYHRKFSPRFWVHYYKEATIKFDKCLNFEGLAEIHYQAGKLYSHDQLTEDTNKAVKSAYELLPNNWKYIDAYVHRTSPFLTENIAIPLIEKIGILAGENATALYRQGFLYERYATKYHNTDYKQLAIIAYQNSIELGLQNTTMSSVVEDAKKAFIRLKDF